MPALPVETQSDRHNRLARARKRGADSGQRHHHRPAADRAPRRTAGERATSAYAIRSGGHVRPWRLADRSPDSRSRGQSQLAVRRRHQDQRPRIRRHSTVRNPQRRSGVAHRSRPRPAVGPVGLRSHWRRHRRQRPRRRARRERERRGGIVRLCAAPALRRRSQRPRLRCPARSASSGRPASTASMAAGTRTAIVTCRAGCAAPGTLPRMSSLAPAGFALTGRSQFDGFDPVTFAHTDTRDSSRNRLTAGRLWASIGGEPRHGAGKSPDRCSARPIEIFLADVEQNRTRGDRRNLSAQLERHFSDRIDIAPSDQRGRYRARGVPRPRHNLRRPLPTRTKAAIMRR